MMDIFATYQLEILLTCNALVLISVSMAVLRVQRMIRKRDEFWSSLTGAHLIDEAAQDNALCGFLDHRLALLHRRIDALAATPKAPETKPAAEPVAKVPAMPFEYAVRMARQGAGVDDLVQACGLNRAEATLIHRVHGVEPGESPSMQH